MIALVQAGYLTLWGIAILLCWVCTLRLINLAHVALALRGYIRTPKHIMGPMLGWTDIGFTLVALASGNATLIAFADSATGSLHFPGWFTFHGLSPWLQMVRIVCALSVLLFFLTRVAENPRYKLWWAACWGAFSLAVVSLA